MMAQPTRVTRPKVRPIGWRYYRGDAPPREGLITGTGYEVPPQPLTRVERLARLLDRIHRQKENLMEGLRPGASPPRNDPAGTDVVHRSGSGAYPFPTHEGDTGREGDEEEARAKRRFIFAAWLDGPTDRRALRALWKHVNEVS
jgi:hypothetical protein